MTFFLNLRTYWQEKLDRNQIQKLKKIQRSQFKGLQHVLYQALWGSNLKILSLLYNTDKWGSHWYAQHYQKFFSSYRMKKINLLEIGIGGYDDSEDGGASLRMWRTYFPNANIYGIDIYDKSPHNERRIKTFKGSQIDENFLLSVIKNIGQIDIIIDDGSHLNNHVIQSFLFLFPYLNENGLYVIEDTQTSYWSSFGGSSVELNRSDTISGFFKGLIDALNYTEYELENYKPSYLDLSIISMSFYHNMIFIQKGLNNEESNWKGRS